ncbi:MAG: glycosyltransferase family 4 protein [Candidatus Sumerlaeota bacterium]|nr:glycosyltransferase family 4 protein [Candidatus Sumerlaeota bacterium]
MGSRGLSAAEATIARDLARGTDSMRILYLCADPGVPILGRKGCSTHVREICRALTRAGHQALILCANRGEDVQDASDLSIVEVPPLQSRRLGFDVRLMTHNLRFARAARKIYEGFRPDVIYERFSMYSFTGHRLVGRYRAPRILEVNAFLSTEQSDRLRFPWFARWSDRFVVGRAEHVVVVSEPLRDLVASLGVPRAHIYKMPMSADVRHFTPAKSGEKVRAQHGLHGRFVIGYVGALTGWHGINLLYDVARLLEPKIHDFVFFLVGGDEKKIAAHQKKARRLGLESRFVFAGSVPYLQVPEYVRAMDVTIIPDTTYWSSPTKLFEYQAAGVPTVAPRYAAIVDAMEEGKEGLFFDAHDTEQFADCLTQLALNPQLRQLMGANARRRVVESHSVDRQVAALIEIMERLSGKTPPNDRRR